MVGLDGSILLRTCPLANLRQYAKRSRRPCRCPAVQLISTVQLLASTRLPATSCMGTTPATHVLVP